MAFLVDFCTIDSPSLNANGALGIFWPFPTSGVFNIQITGTLTNNGAPYSFTTNETVNTSLPALLAYTYNKDLKAGTYTVVVTEQATNAQEVYNFTIIDVVAATSYINISATPGACSGTGSITFTYGNTEYVSMIYCLHLLSNPPTPANCNGGSGWLTAYNGQPVTVSGLAPGTYQLRLQGCKSCSPSPFIVNSVQVIPGTSVCNNGSSIITLDPPAPNSILITTTSVDTVCDTAVGVIYVDSISGQSPYTYSWTGPNGFTSTDEDLVQLEAGVYTLNVTDANGCTGTTSVTIVSVPDPNGCGGPVTCYKVENCNPDCFGTKIYYLTSSDLAGLVGYIINGLQIEGEVINPNDCWTVLETSAGESTPPSFPCYIDFNIGNPGIPLRFCEVLVNGNSIYTGPTTATDTAEFIINILTPGNIDSNFEVSTGSTPVSFNICATDFIYAGASVEVSFEWFDNGPKIWIPVSVVYQLDNGSPGTGCYVAETFLGYNTAFSSCETCQPVDCPAEPVYETVIQHPVKIFYEIKESACDITVVKQFATAYSNMLKKVKYGIADCCNGLNIGETWVNKQISSLQEKVITGYNCREIPMQGCSWLPLQGCELLTSNSDGVSILAIAGEDITFAKLVMLGNDGKLYLNNPFVITNYQRAVGFSTMDVLANNSTRILITGTITNPNWSLVTGAIYFAAGSGNITTIVPTTGISQAIGIAMNPTTLLVELKQPNIL